TRRDPFTDSVHGVSWEDAYRWLEPESEEALAWDANENALTDRYFAEWPGYEVVKRLLTENPTPSIRAGSVCLFGPQACGDRWVRIQPRRDGYQQLILSDEPLGDGEVVFDPKDMASDEQVLSAAFASPDGRYVVLGLRDAYDASDPETWGR